MLRKHCRQGMKSLMSDDFVGESDNVEPSQYTKKIFDMICEAVVAGNAVEIPVIKMSFLADIKLSDESKQKYVKIVEKLEKMKIDSESIEYFYKACESLRQYTCKRKLDSSFGQIKAAVEEDDLFAVGEAMRGYFAYESRLSSARRDEAKILDYKEHYEVRKNKVMAGDHGSNVLYTGFPPIDDNSGGLRKGELCVFLARTSGGKSVWMQDLVANIVEMGYNGAYFSKEDSAESVSFRLDARFTEIEHLRFRRSELTYDDYGVWDKKIKAMRDNALKVVCMGKNFNTQEVNKVYSNLYNMGFEADLVICDYIGIMKPSVTAGAGAAKWEKMDTVVCELKDLAVELDVPVVTAAQLKPEAYNNDNVTIEDIAYGKLAVSSHADQIFAFIQTDAMKVMKMAKIQMLKGRGSGIIHEFYDVQPQMNIIKIHKSWKTTCEAVTNEGSLI